MSRDIVDAERREIDASDGTVSVNIGDTRKFPELNAATK
jgi:hypothetical protein